MGTTFGQYFLLVESLITGRERRTGEGGSQGESREVRRGEGSHVVACPAAGLTILECLLDCSRCRCEPPWPLAHHLQHQISLL